MFLERDPSEQKDSQLLWRLGDKINVSVVNSHQRAHVFLNVLQTENDVTGTATSNRYNTVQIRSL